MEFDLLLDTLHHLSDIARVVASILSLRERLQCWISFASCSAMGMKRFETVGDLCRFGANLRVVCRCGHVAIIDNEQLHHQYMRRHWPSSLGTVVMKLKCSRCGCPPKEWSPSPREATIRIGPTVMEVRSSMERNAKGEASRTSDEP
ncbi:hypothetical protein [Sphingomonas sp. Leaf25]|uniref:hypothetical protein n=1 Tax=Sphingomonas sp. Leaf25 TaxID=1735692 RepID=UPI00070027AA|nr:hypothetical protein [Sphingomonas sp. Leaf25]KQN00551.1 hypothetical protein ASE78_05550 [Sphingomonas sp. Leaf25]